jgi:hypothetical protein
LADMLRGYGYRITNEIIILIWEGKKRK